MCMLGKKRGWWLPLALTGPTLIFPQSLAILLRYSMLDVRLTTIFFFPGNSSLNR